MAAQLINDDGVTRSGGGGGGGGVSLQQMLQLVVQRLQWTYSLFWQLCPQQGALVWADGHYNGAIKTRKMVQPVEATAEEVSLQRSQQLRELYESLSLGEENQPSRRPCAALSPEDLTESEWFYLMCISFFFPPGVGMPGKAFEKQQAVWLAGANEVDSKVFSRAILAKGAQIKTVVFIPVGDGVLEVGTTDSVEEDQALIHLMKSFFSGYRQQPLHGNKPALSEHSTSTPAAANDGRRQHLRPPSLDAIPPPPPPPADLHRYDDGDHAGDEDDDDDDDDDEDEEEPESSSDSGNGGGGKAEPTEMVHMQTPEEILLGSPEDCSNDLDADLQMLALCRAAAAAAAVGGGGGGGESTGGMQSAMSEEDAHYSQTVSTILQHNPSRWAESCSSGRLLERARQSAFGAWSGGAAPTAGDGATQWMLKQALHGVPYLHDRCKEESGSPRTAEAEGGATRFRRGGGGAPQEEMNASHVLAERRRREKLNERFITLRSMVPCVTKMDKASILGDTIEYLKKLLRRIQEMETQIKFMEAGRRTSAAVEVAPPPVRGRVPPGEPERKKLRAIAAVGAEISVQVSIIEADALLELQCPNRDGLLLRMLQTVHDLGLETTSVESSSAAGVLVAQIRAKVVEGPLGRTTSIVEVKKALHRLLSP